MPSQHTKWYEDVRLIQALDDLRLKKLGFMSKCYFCGESSVGIKAVDEKLFSVCEVHNGDK